MEHKGAFYTVFEGASGAFRWTVSLASGNRVGEAPSRSLATLQAIRTINKDQQQTKAAERKAARILESKIGTSEP